MLLYVHIYYSKQQILIDRAIPEAIYKFVNFQLIMLIDLFIKH